MIVAIRGVFLRKHSLLKPFGFHIPQLGDFWCRWVPLLGVGQLRLTACRSIQWPLHRLASFVQARSDTCVSAGCDCYNCVLLSSILRHGLNATNGCWVFRADVSMAHDPSSPSAGITNRLAVNAVGLILGNYPRLGKWGALFHIPALQRISSALAVPSVNVTREY